MASNVFERWLISMTDMPTPGRLNMSLCASSRTGTGKIAGPALKLKMRSVICFSIIGSDVISLCHTQLASSGQQAASPWREVQNVPLQSWLDWSNLKLRDSSHEPGLVKPYQLHP